MRAGASGVMCSYNKVNGTYACADAGAIARDLKATMGFRGFVQSDWGATHSASSVTAGLDQEMPMTYDYREAGVLAGRYYYDARNLGAHDGAAVDEAATRILTPVARLRLLNRSYCTPPCEAELRANVTSAAHAALASLRRFSAFSLGCFLVAPYSRHLVSYSGTDYRQRCTLEKAQVVP